MKRSSLSFTQCLADDFLVPLSLGLLSRVDKIKYLSVLTKAGLSRCIHKCKAVGVYTASKMIFT